MPKGEGYGPTFVSAFNQFGECRFWWPSLREVGCDEGWFNSEEGAGWTGFGHQCGER